MAFNNFCWKIFRERDPAMTLRIILNFCNVGEFLNRRAKQHFTKGTKELDVAIGALFILSVRATIALTQWDYDLNIGGGELPNQRVNVRAKYALLHRWTAWLFREIVCISFCEVRYGHMKYQSTDLIKNIYCKSLFKYS